MYKLNNFGAIETADGSRCFPPDPANSDYQQYLTWLAEGNTPEPADPPTKDEINTGIWAQIRNKELTELMPRTLREFLMEQHGANQKPWFSKVKQLDDEVTALKATLIP